MRHFEKFKYLTISRSNISSCQKASTIAFISLCSPLVRLLTTSKTLLGTLIFLGQVPLIYGSFFGSEDHWKEVDARRHALLLLWRPILDLQALEQDGHVNVVSVTGWLAESFRRCRFSAAAVFLPSSKLSAAVLIVPLHSSLSSASASHSLWSMPACVSCRFNWSLKRLRGAPRSRFP